MKPYVARILVLTAVVASVTSAAAEMAGSEPARLTVDPTYVNLAPGQHGFISVQVRGVPQPGLAAFQVVLRFDPQVVRVVDPNAGFVSSGVPTFAPLGGVPLCAAVRQLPTCPDPEWMMTSTGRQPFGTSSIDNTHGSVTIAFGTAGDADLPAGGGTLALLEVVGTGGGRASFEVTDAILADGYDPPHKYAIAALPQPRPTRLRRRIERTKTDGRR